MVDSAYSTDQSKRECWARVAQEGEFRFHVTNDWRRTERFTTDTSRFFQFFGFGPDDFRGCVVLDLGAGSRLRSKFFKNARIIALEPLAERFLAEIDWCDIRDAWRVYSEPAEKMVPELEGQVDFIMCINVLDHTYDPLRILINARKYLKASGQMLLSVDLHSKAGRMHPEHFDRKKLKALVEKAGFSIQWSSLGLPSSDAYGHGKACTVLLTPAGIAQEWRGDFLFVCSNGNQVKIFAPVANQLRDSGQSVRFLSLDLYYGQGAGKELSKLDFVWTEMPTSLGAGDWFERSERARRPLAFEAAQTIEAMFAFSAPVCLVVANDMGTLEQFCLRAAERYGTRTVFMAEGAHWALPISHSQTREKIMAGDGGCELLCLCGESVAGRMAEKGVSGQIVVTGNPRYDSLAEYQSSSSGNYPLTVVLAGGAYAKYGCLSADEEYAIYERLLRLLAQRNNIHIIFKLHPQQDLIRYLTLNKVLGKRVEVLRDVDSLALLKRTDVLIAISSTTILEAVLMGVPTMMLPYLGGDETHPDFEGLPFVVKSEEDFLRLLDAPDFPNNLRLEPQIREAFIRKTMYALDGKAGARVAEAIMKLTRRADITLQTPQVSVLMVLRTSKVNPVGSVRSVLRSGTIPLEVVVVDQTPDGAVGRSLKDEVTDERLRVLHEPRITFGAALNKALSVCKGDVVARIEPTCLALPGWAEKLNAALVADSGCAFAVSWFISCNDLGKFRWICTLPADSKAIWKDQNLLPAPVYAYRRRFALANGGYSEITDLDCDFALMGVLQDSGKSTVVPAPLYAVMKAGSPFTKPTRVLKSALERHCATNELDISVLLCSHNRADTLKRCPDALEKQTLGALGESNDIEQTGLEYEPVLQPATKEKSPARRLSVILTTYNRQRLLTKVLSGFANQTAPKEDFEVIVVDDGSEPPVKEVVEKFYDRINITYLHQENSGLAAARNNGIRAANGDIILLCDDDDVPAPELIAEHLRSHQEHPDEQIAVLGYRYWHPDLEITPVMHHIIHVGGEYFGYDRMSDGEIYDHWKFWGGVTSVKTTLLEGMKGPFDSRLGFGYEDTELSCRLASKGLRVLYNSKAKSFVLVPVDFEGFCKRRYMQGRALYRMACIHPEVIIPRYHLQDAANLYHSRYAPFLEEWVDKVVKFEPLLNNQTRLKDFEHNRYLKSLYTVYRECFKGYWLKGYVEEMETVKGGRVSLSEPVNTKGGSHFAKDWKMASAGVAGNNVESGYDQLNAPRVAEPLRITFISSHTPGFDRGSSNLRIYHILKIVEGSGARIDYLYFCRTEDDERYKKAFGDSVNFVYMPRKINCFTDYLYFDRSRKIDYVWITNLWGVAYGKFAIKLSEWIKANKSGTKIIIDTMDFHYKKFMRKFNVSRDNQDLLKAKEFLEVEKKLYPLADEVLTVTEVEKRDIFENIGSDCNVSVISNIHRILPQGPDLQQRKHICFIGAFHVNHNIDAVRWFLREVFPLIIEKAPEVEFHILGSNSEKFRAEFEVNPNVKVIGYVEDAESAVANYRLFVSPMTYGAGMKGKLGTAASAGTPIVTTTIGAEGFDFVDGQNCFIADDPQEFARECLCLLSEASLWKEFSIKAKEMVAEKFGIEAVSEKIHNLLRPATTVESADKVTTCAAEVPASSDYADAVQKSRPKVSIITSCYNSEKFLPECIDSIRNQTMQDWELFLLDDASTDGTKSIIEKYSRMDERIRPYYFHDNKGPYVRRNFAIERANSDFIVIQDADDIMCPAKLETLYDEITRDKQLGIVGSFYRSFLDEFRGLEYTDSHDLPLEHNEIADKFSNFRHGMSHGSAIIRKDLFEAIGLYDENPFAADTFWFAKAAEYAKHYLDTKFKNVPEYLTLVRIHDNSQTQLLPTFDPRNKRVLYHQHCNEKLGKVRQKLKELPHADIKTELKNCVCSDFIEKYGHLSARWEDVPLAPDAFDGRLGRAVWSFNERNHVTCITRLNSLEKVEPNIAKRFKNYDLLRAMAYFAIDRKKQSLTYLNREIENHNNPAARKFISDYFEGPDFAETVQNVNSEKRLKTDVQSWCLENDKFYDLRIIDLENERDTQQEKRVVCRQNVPAPQGEQGHSCPTSSSGQTGPLVSIIMPVYNMPDYVAEAIGSVLTQSYKNFELIVADDGSTDNTKDIILGFKDERVKYFYKENGGPYSARNLGMKNAGGDFIVPLDADDMITPDYIARHLQEFERCPDADLIYCDDCLIEEDCKPIRVIERPEYTDRKLLIRDLFRCGFPIVPFRTCIRKSVFDRIGLFDDGFRNAMDYDMIRRFVKHGLKAHHLKAPLYLRRMTPDSVSRKVSDEKVRAHFEVLRRFTESFSYDELFPDVAWDKIAPEMRQLHAKCLAAMTYLAIGQTYVKTNSPIYARTAFGKACSELRDSLKMDPGNTRIRQLLQKCEFGRQRYDEQIQQAVR